MIAVALFAALLVPLFVDWNDYRATFAAQAEKILGQPVTIAGDAAVTILPMPLLTFDRIEIGNNEGRPMMSVGRFEARIELLPLLGGQIRIAELKLIKPKLIMLVDDDGRLDWQIRTVPMAGFDPDSVEVRRILVEDGEIEIADARTGGKFRFTEIVTDQVEAPSLLGPWRVSARLKLLDEPVALRISTGRQLPDGSVRMTAELEPAASHVAGTLFTDGTLKFADTGPYYEGDFSFRRQREAAEGASNLVDTAWRMAGVYKLDPQQLVVSSFTVNEGSGNTPFGISGALSVNFGSASRFAAEITSEQIDLDLPEGEGKEAKVTTALAGLMTELSSLPVPAIPGRVGVSIPAIVVGGGVIEKVSFDALPADKNWQIRDLSVQLPGEAGLTANGTLSTGSAPRFFGTVGLFSNQPAAFSAWLSGDSGLRLRLSRFDVTSRLAVARGEVVAEQINARLGDSQASGRLVWESKAGEPPRLEATLAVDRVFLDDLTAFSNFLARGTLLGEGRVAEEVAIQFSAGTITTGRVAANDVVVAANLANDTLTVRQIRIGGLAGASLTVDGGEIADLSGQPRGKLVARFQAATLGGVAEVAAELWPGNAVSFWLKEVGSALAPVALTAEVNAGGAEGAGRFEVDVEGTAGSSRVAATIGVAGSPLAWRSAATTAAIRVESDVAAELARQLGWPALAVGDALPAVIEVKADGVPEQGMNSEIAADVAGARLEVDGMITFAAAGSEIDGSFRLDAADLDPLLLMAGYALPGVGLGTPASISGGLDFDAVGGTLSIDNSKIGDQNLSGRLGLTLHNDGWRVGGALSLDTLDLPWLLSLGLGAAPVPTGVAEAPWPTDPFAGSTVAGLRADLDMQIARLAIATDLTVEDAALAIQLRPEALVLELGGGSFAGGTAEGALNLQNPTGHASVSGSFALTGAGLGPLLWEAEGGPAVDGAFDLAANFEGAGNTTAELVAGLTGGGAFVAKDGTIRGIDLARIATLIAETDAGTDFAAADLAERLMAEPAGGEILFGQASGEFALSGGTVRLRDVSVAGEGVSIAGDAELALPTLTATSDWTLTVTPPDRDGKDVLPSLRVSLAGPLADPERTVDATPLARYLSVRTLTRLERLQDADLERERHQRMLKVLEEQAAQREREAEDERLAAQARAEAEARALREAIERGLQTPAPAPN